MRINKKLAVKYKKNKKFKRLVDTILLCYFDDFSIRLKDLDEALTVAKFLFGVMLFGKAETKKKGKKK